jgi:hypothetical protein
MPANLLKCKVRPEENIQKSRAVNAPPLKSGGAKLQLDNRLTPWATFEDERQCPQLSVGLKLSMRA